MHTPQMSMPSNPHTEPDAFPAGAIVVDVYRFAIEHIVYALRLSWAWVLVAASALVATDLLVGDAFSSNANRDGVADWSSFAVVLLYALPIASIAVAWHRLLLLGEQVSTAIYLRIDRIVWSYLGLAVLIQFIAWLPYIVPWLLRQAFKAISALAFGMSYDRNSAIDFVLSDKGLLASPIVQIFAIAVFFIFATRFGIALPAKAIGVRGVTLKAVWQATQGHSYGLVVGMLLSVLPIALVFVGVRLAGLDFSAEDGSLLHILDRLTFVAFETMLGLVQVAFLSYSFLHFFPPDKAVTIR